MESTEPWTEADGAALRRTRVERGHRWHHCVAALVDLGAPSLTQGTLSKWENGKTAPKLPESIRAVRAYCSHDADSDEPPIVADQVDGANLDDDSRFNDTVEAILGERPLSGRRSRVVDALVDRLRSGPPLSEADRAVIELLLI